MFVSRRIAVVIISAIALAVVGSGAVVLWKTQPVRKWRAERYAHKAEALLRGNAKDAAILACTNALQLNPDDLLATRVLISAVSPADLDKLTFLRSRIADLDPSDRDNLEQLATHALATRRNTLAGTAIALLTREKGDSGVIPELRVRFALATGQTAAAEVEAKRLLEKDADNMVGRLVLALADVQNSRVDRLPVTKNELQELSGIKAVRIEALRGLREIAAKSGNLVEAIEYVDQIVNTPGSAFVDYLSRADLMLRQSPECLEELLASLTVQAKDDSESFEWIVSWLRKCGRMDRALTWVEETPALAGDSLSGGVLKSKILIELRDWAQLTSFLNQKDWGEGDFLRKAFLARAAAEQREDLQSSVYWREAVALALERHGTSRHLLEVSRSWPGWSNKTEDLLWEISRQQPRNASWALGQLYRSYDRNRSAKSLLRVNRALAELEPSNQKIRNNIAFFSLLTGDSNFEQIKDPLVVLYQANVDDPVIASTYALLQLKLQQPENAVKALEKLPAETLARDDIAVYYAVALQASGRVGKAQKVVVKINKERLFPEEVALLTPLFTQKAPL